MFNKYKKNYFSESGEDGVILELLKRIKLRKRKLWCCEFGAWDGVRGSNTFHLVKNFNYNAVYIEGDGNRFKDLLKTQKKSQLKAFHRIKSSLLFLLLDQQEYQKE